MGMTQGITLAVGIVALIGSYTATNILSCMVASYELLVGCLFVSFVTAVFLKERCKALLVPAIFSVAFGAIGFVVVKTFDFGVWGQVIPLFLSAQPMAVGLLFAKPKPEMVAEPS